MDENPQLKKGLECHQAGNFPEAEKYYLSIIKKTPDDIQTLFLLGSLYGQTQQYANAIEILSTVVRLKKNHEEAYRNLSLSFELAQQPLQAIAILEQALEHLPNSKFIHNDLGDIYRKSEKNQQATKHFQHSLNIDPHFEASIVNLAITLSSQENFSQSETLFLRALKINPNNSKTLSNYSALLNLCEKYSLAEKQAKKALTINPSYAQAINNLGYAYLKQSKLDSAITQFRQAIKLKPDYIDAYNNLGFSLHLQSEFDSALEVFNQAVEISPDNADAHFYRSFTHLLLGNFSIAWDDYEYGIINQQRGKIEPPFIKWDKKEQHATILITAEQGVGDQIMFASCLPDLIKFNKNIILECEPRLVTLFSRSFPTIKVVAHRQSDNINRYKALADVDCYLPIGSLPSLFRRNQEDFYHTSHYLRANFERLHKWQSRLKKIGRGLNVGFSWKAGIKVDHKKRSITLEECLAILNVPGCNFINLQYGNVAEEIEQLKQKHGITIHEWQDSDSLKDIDGFAAKIAALDLVISVGNTNVHLAGSQNIPTWCIIPHVPSWRWMDSGKHSVWYQSVKLYRQTDSAGWFSILGIIAQDLSTLTIHERK